MEAEIEFELSEELMQRAAKRYTARAIPWCGLPGKLIMVVIAVVFVALSALCLFAPGGERFCAPVPLVGVVAVLGFYFYWATRRAAVQAARSIRLELSKMPHRHVEWRVSDEGIEMTDAFGHGRHPWDLMTAVWRFPEFWLLFEARSRYFVVPADAIPPAAGDFIVAKVREHGGKVA